jgi:hypothetical protein
MGFNQAPAFPVREEFNPVVVIEAKLTEDVGSAGEKVTCVQIQSNLRDESNPHDDVVVCIAGRRAKVRGNDMRRPCSRQWRPGRRFHLGVVGS